MKYLLGALLSPYRPGYLVTLTYMLQSVEYRPWPFLAWFWRTQHFGTVMRRRRLERTRPARALLWFLRLGAALQVVAGITAVAAAWRGALPGGWYFGVALLIAYPVVWAHLVVLPLVLGRLLISGPRERRALLRARHTLASFKGMKIAVAGSYGKTSMKELLATILGEGKIVAATPANLNVAASHARFAANLRGDEEVLIIEYGEGRPGDIARLAALSQPTHAVITGLAPAHLDRYADLEAAGRDIFSLSGPVKDRHIYVNAESEAIAPFMKKGFHTYDRKGALGWRVHDAAVSFEGTRFVMSKSGRSLHLHSPLLGLHHVGPLALAAALALESGLSEAQVTSGIARTSPFEHRMQPYRLNGAWIIDDTYNGTLEGIRAGTALLAALPARHKTYVTPGLVDQGKMAAQVHRQVGGLIAAAHPDTVVLMHNSAADDIRRSLDEAGYAGMIRIEPDPLKFYTGMKDQVAAGDLMMLQNDWTDNYA